MKERSGEEAGLSLVAAAAFDEQISGKGVVVGSVVTVVGGVVVVVAGGLRGSGKVSRGGIHHCCPLLAQCAAI